MTNDNPTLYQVDPSMMNLTGEEVDVFNKLLAEWQRHIGSNIRNEAYYEGKVKPVTTDKSMPKDLVNLDIVMGWGGKCVDVLANRSVLAGFEGENADAMDDIVPLNSLVEIYEQAVTSELTDSCAFLTVSKGLAGEPDVIVSAHSALDAAAIWDERKKRIKAGICVVDIDVDSGGQRVPTWVNMYTDSYTYSCRKVGDSWVAEKVANPFGRPLMEPLRYRPSLTRPFGKSRINRTVRSLINRALCVGARTEITATFYTWPMRYLLGVDKKTAENMAKRKVEMYADSILFVTPNKNGDVPQLGQLSQMSMQPHIDHLEMLGKQFASEACIPLDEVGIVFDNPTSSEAMFAAQQRLIVEAEHVNRMNGIALGNIARMALGAVDAADFATADITPRFADVLRPSKAANADFAIKVNSAVPAYSGTRQFWRDLGYSESTIDSILRDVRYTQIVQAAAQASAQVSQQQATPQAEGISDADTSE